MALFNWSQTPASNASADPTINYSEGQAPSSLNDSARAAMAAVAKYRDDISGAIVTSGSSTSYTVASNSGYDSLAHLANQMIAFSPHATNGATVTLNVDGLGAKPLRSAPNAELLAGTIIQGTPYVALYNSSDGAFYLQGFVGNPYNIPIGAGMDFWAPTAPNSSFVFPFGQAISRTTYSTYFGMVGTTFGAGDGSTTFNLPDKRGRLAACVDNLGGTTANRLTSGSMAGVRHTLGGAGGADTNTLTAAAIPSITSAQVNTIVVTVPGGQPHFPVTDGTIADVGTAVGGNRMPNQTGGSWGHQDSMSGNNTISVTSNNTGGGAHDNLQPTILCNYILRII